MTMDLANAMRAAINLTRDQKPVEATRVIQTALSGREPFPSSSRSEAATADLAGENQIIDLTAEVIEPETTASVRADTPSRQSHSGTAPWMAGLGEVLATADDEQVHRSAHNGRAARSLDPSVLRHACDDA